MISLVGFIGSKCVNESKCLDVFDIISAWFLPLLRRRKLPPGVAKQLARHGTSKNQPSCKNRKQNIDQSEVCTLTYWPIKTGGVWGGWFASDLKYEHRLYLKSFTLLMQRIPCRMQMTRQSDISVRYINQVAQDLLYMVVCMIFHLRTLRYFILIQCCVGYGYCRSNLHSSWGHSSHNVLYEYPNKTQKYNTNW